VGLTMPQRICRNHFLILYGLFLSVAPAAPTTIVKRDKVVHNPWSSASVLRTSMADSPAARI
jgi:hypothetical protein